MRPTAPARPPASGRPLETTPARAAEATAAQGGQGGGYTPTDSLGGAAYPAGNSLTGPLYGGSGGGTGLNGGTLGLGGGGGGAIEIHLGQVNLFSAVTSNGGLAGVAANGYGGGGGGSGGSCALPAARSPLRWLGRHRGQRQRRRPGGGGFNAGGGGGGGRVLIQQNASPLATGVTANGGAARSRGRGGYRQRRTTHFRTLRWPRCSQCSHRNWSRVWAGVAYSSGRLRRNNLRLLRTYRKWIYEFNSCS